MALKPVKTGKRTYVNYSSTRIMIMVALLWSGYEANLLVKQKPTDAQNSLQSQKRLAKVICPQYLIGQTSQAACIRSYD